MLGLSKGTPVESWFKKLNCRSNVLKKAPHMILLLADMEKISHECFLKVKIKAI